MPAFDFDRAPFLVIWEATRACALACVHCRADAFPCGDPRELSTEEGFRLIDQVRAIGDPPPLFVITGGDPMRRGDLAALVEYAADAGLIVALTPSGTAAATSGGGGVRRPRPRRVFGADGGRGAGAAHPDVRVVLVVRAQ